MQVFALFLAAFIASTAANPFVKKRESCPLGPTLKCAGGPHQNLHCVADTTWECLMDGAAPAIESDPTCAADCVCDLCPQ
ncbi:hypothetical protein FB45DRAFT_1031773 [Roridomyces roridus]|uniref:Uncharacterized protein n=1 Tax=Roridomyces roridus TaxID=1738132 RepID=A0AAD7BIL1_9AGAR|nr:hypothetical protein FB45DRAFT_1031773 [Roridomyces roridus]